MSNDTTCPCCGSTELVNETTTRTYTPPFGPTVKFEVQWHRCHDCTKAWQIAGQSEHIKAVIHQADQDSVKVMLGDLMKAGLEPTAIAQMLRLPMDIVQRWNDGTATLAEIVVLRMVRAFLGLANSKSKSGESNNDTTK